LEGVGPLICERKALVLFCHQLFIMLIWSLLKASINISKTGFLFVKVDGVLS
jgi:hypothetical protein